MVFTMQDPSAMRRDSLVQRRRVSKMEKLSVSRDAAPTPLQHESPHIADLPTSTPDAHSFLNLLPNQLREIPSRFYHTAEEIEDHLRNLPSQARHKAEELGEELMAMPGYAMHKAEELGEELIALPGKAIASAEDLAWKVWEVVHHTHLPDWMRDNEYLVAGHRPQLHTYIECFKSVFRIHTETGNIWTHLLGFLAFLFLAFWFGVKMPSEMPVTEMIAFYAFFLGAILCLGFSWLFHTLYCHSEHVGKVFCKLDYSGIALLTMGSFVPWCYYSFHTNVKLMTFYILFINVLGALCIFVSMSDKFAEPEFRALRAGVFIGLGLSGVIPVTHVVIVNGFWESFYFAALGWMILMAFLYIGGAIIYACRIPERIWPGKFDIWFQSHQIFHVFVIAAAFVHYHGISEIANNRLNGLSFSSFSTIPVE